MSYTCPQCGASAGRQHEINCYFEGGEVKDPKVVLENILLPYFVQGDNALAAVDTAVAEIIEELNL